MLGIPRATLAIAALLLLTSLTGCGDALQETDSHLSAPLDSDYLILESETFILPSGHPSANRGDSRFFIWGSESMFAIRSNPPMSLRERTFWTPRILRARLSNVEGAVRSGVVGGGESVLTFEFDVLEYLKGIGSDKLRVIVPQGRKYISYPDHLGYRSADEAEANLNKRMDDLDIRWDDREAIIFGYAEGDLRYFSNGAWLTAASPESSKGASNDDARFRLPRIAEPRVWGASWSDLDTPSTVSLSELKEMIAETNAESARMSESQESDDYRRCIARRYSSESFIEWSRESGGLNAILESDLKSGLPAGSVVAEEDRLVAMPGEFWLGQQYNLFAIDIEWNRFGHTPLEAAKVVTKTNRPLPAGDHAVYYNFQPEYWTHCDYYPEDYATAHQRVVRVAAQTGTLHEAFFDPVAAGASVGADATRGVLEPTEIAVGDTFATINKIEWDSQRVRMEFNQRVLPPGYTADFIALDGSVAFRLDFADAEMTAKDTLWTLTWPICAPPWKDGDKLMLRITDSRYVLDDFPAAGDAPCQAP